MERAEPPSEPTTTVLEESNIRTIVSPETKLLTVSVTTAYNMVLIALTLFILNICLQDIMSIGTVDFHAEIFEWCWSSIHIAVLIWLCILVSTMLAQVGICVWVRYRVRFAKETPGLTTWDRFWFGALVLFFSCFLVLPGVAVYHAGMPPSSNVAVLMEQVRLFMKIYAYIRTHIQSVMVPMAPALPSLADEPNLTLSHFMYFLFAPTLVYQDNYKRTARCKKRKVMRHIMEVIVCVFTVYLIYMRCIHPLSQELLVHADQNKAFGLTGPAAGAMNWLLMMVRVTPSSIFLSLVLFYTVLNAMQMIFAEILRFEDRRFYLDWWNVSSFKTWFRTWNLLVQRWLYRYVFRELAALGLDAFAVRAWVFFLSAVFHEYIIALALGFFYPIQYFMFGICGFVMSYVPTEGKNRASAAGNTFVLFGFFFGTGMMMTSYCLEYQARNHCPRVLASWVDTFVPRSWFCSQLYEANGITS